MPIYDYRCEQCQHVFDQLVRSSDTPACPQCRSQQLHKLLSIPAPTPAQGVLPEGCGGGGCMPECGAGGCAFN